MRAALAPGVCQASRAMEAHMNRRLIGISLAAFAATALMLAPPAYAASQILGLIASAEPTKLTCENGLWSAEFSSFCLQEHRKAPNPGTAYVPSKGSDLSLIVTAADGTTKTLPAARFVKVESLRTFTAVSVSLTESTLRALGGKSVAIKVGKMASVVPVASPTDTQPMSAAEIIQFTGPVRAMAETVRNPASAAMMTAQLSNSLVNTLPISRPPSDSEYQQIWDRAVRNLPPGDGTSEALRYLKREYRDCRFIASLDGGYSMFGTSVRTCIGGVHDEIMQDFTKEVWKTVRTGS